MPRVLLGLLVVAVLAYVVRWFVHARRVERLLQGRQDAGAPRVTLGERVRRAIRLR